MLKEDIFMTIIKPVSVKVDGGSRLPKITVGGGFRVPTITVGGGFRAA